MEKENSSAVSGLDENFVAVRSVVASDLTEKHTKIKCFYSQY